MNTNYNPHSLSQRKSQLLITLLVVVGLWLGATSLSLPVAQAQTTNLALNKPVTCSSVENAGSACANAVDGSTTTRWSSAFSDPQWIRVDLGSTQAIGRVVLRWEAAYGKSYQIQLSNDLTNWTNIYTTTTGNGGIDDLTGLSGSGRYVRMMGTVRATQYGYSLWEFEVYGAGPTPTNTPTRTNTLPPSDTPTNTPAGPLPDLMVTSITFARSIIVCQNQHGTNVTVANVGSANAGAFVVWFKTSNNQQSTQNVSGLAAGASITLRFNFLDGHPTAMADYTNVIAESNESNNSLTALIPLPSYEPTCTPTATNTTPTATPTGPTPTPTPTRTNTPIPSGNLALNKPVTCSSIQGTGTPCAAAVDGNTGTRWSSAFSDPQWIQVDLGQPMDIGRIVLRWEAAYGKAYQLQTSNPGTNWTTIYSTTTGDGGVDDVTVAVTARYVRMYGTVRATPYGYSLWEFEVHASPVIGWVSVASGCCVGGVAGNPLNIFTTFSATSNAGAVTQMRVASQYGGGCVTDLSAAAWEPYATSKIFTIQSVAINWVNFYVSVQYRDAAGNISPLYCDDVSVEGFPPTPTPTP